MDTTIDHDALEQDEVAADQLIRVHTAQAQTFLQCGGCQRCFHAIEQLADRKLRY